MALDVQQKKCGSVVVCVQCGSEIRAEADAFFATCHACQKTIPLLNTIVNQIKR
jgi:primosomal protein N'